MRVLEASRGGGFYSIQTLKVHRGADPGLGTRAESDSTPSSILQELTIQQGR